MEGAFLVQKSRTGKKKRNPYQGKQAAAPVQSKEDPNAAQMKKVNRIWMMGIILCLIGMIFGGTFEQGSMYYKIINIVCYGGLVVIGAYMLYSAKVFEKKGTATMNKIFGVMLIVLGVMQLVVLF